MSRTEPQTWPPLSGRCSRLLKDGDGWERYASTHKALAALTGGMVKAGWTVDQACDALTDQRYEAARRLKHHYGGNLISQVRSKFLASQRKAERHSVQAQEQAWVDTLVGGWPHGGRFGATLRVAIALAVLADEAGSFSFTASMRRIAEVAGVGSANTQRTSAGVALAAYADTNTVRHALKRLETWGYLSVQELLADTRWEQVTKANFRYTLVSLGQLNEKFNDPEWNAAMYLEHSPKGTTYPPWVREVLRVHPKQWLHVIWESAALGMSAARICFTLKLCGPMTITELQRALGLSRNCVVGCLRRLDESRLIEQNLRRGTWRATERSLDEVADEMRISERQPARSEAIRQRRVARIQALYDGRPSQRHCQSDIPTGVDPTTGEILGRQAKRRIAHVPARAERPCHEWLPRRHCEASTTTQTVRSSHRRTKVSSGLYGAYRPSTSSLLAKLERANRSPFDDPPVRRKRQLKLAGARRRAEVSCLAA